MPYAVDVRWTRLSVSASFLAHACMMTCLTWCFCLTNKSCRRKALRKPVASISNAMISEEGDGGSVCPRGIVQEGSI